MVNHSTACLDRHAVIIVPFDLMEFRLQTGVELLMAALFFRTRRAHGVSKG